MPRPWRLLLVMLVWTARGLAADDGPVPFAARGGPGSAVRVVADRRVTGLSSFAGVTVGRALVDRWSVRAIGIDAKGISIDCAHDDGRVLLFSVSAADSRQPSSPFDVGDVQISYRSTSILFSDIEPVGRALVQALLSGAGSLEELREAARRELTKARPSSASPPPRMTAPVARDQGPTHSNRAPARNEMTRGCGGPEPVADSGKPKGKASGSRRSVPRFRNVAREAGLDFTWRAPGKRPLTILQTIGNGAAFLDYDNDGNLDILLVGPRPALFKGDGKGKFVDVTASVLGSLEGRFLGCAVGDYDNDGWDDIYLTGYREGRLLHNEGGKRFRDVTVSSGLRAQPWSTSASWTDLDRDGSLDLFIANYVEYSPDAENLCASAGTEGTEVFSACGPQHYEPSKATVWRNVGGRFEEMTKAWGVAEHPGNGLGVASVDFDASGHDAVAVANDMLPGSLFVSSGGGGRLTDIGPESNVAVDAEGRVHAGMGVDWGDYDNDGLLDLVVTTFRDQPKSLYRNQGNRLFTDVSFAAGVGRPVLDWVSFGVKFFDADNDGWLDLVMASGHVMDNAEEVDGATYRQPVTLLQNCGSGGQAFFQDVSDVAGITELGRIVGRGVAVGDYDNDGRVDVLVVDSEGTPLLLHNETPGVGNWLSLRLVGTKGNRSALGALVTVRLDDGRTLLRHCQTDGSYMSASDRRVHVGIGKARKASVTVRWTSGGTDIYSDVPPGRTVTLREGDPAVR